MSGRETENNFCFRCCRWSPRTRVERVAERQRTRQRETSRREKGGKICASIMFSVAGVAGGVHIHTHHTHTQVMTHTHTQR